MSGVRASYLATTRQRAWASWQPAEWWSRKEERSGFLGASCSHCVSPVWPTLRLPVAQDKSVPLCVSSWLFNCLQPNPILNHTKPSSFKTSSKKKMLQTKFKRQITNSGKCLQSKTKQEIWEEMHIGIVLQSWADYREAVWLCAHYESNSRSSSAEMVKMSSYESSFFSGRRVNALGEYLGWGWCTVLCKGNKD